ncbi:MAG: methanogenesis marker 2 protein [Methanophagales archaeon]|nr:methanogenesis marker 2 protein [Methanophagales archaeon]MCW3141163.1 methanogenesis marker 2 protein [Methanophagales archaeon]
MGSAKEGGDLETLAEGLRNFDGVKRKRAISDLVKRLGDSDRVGSRTIIGFGEDAAVLKIDNDNFVLLAVDGIWGRLLNADPWWAGYCAVLVNVNDIAAMGGTPLAMVNLTSTQKKNICAELGRGMEEGVKKFGVPMVGGHLHPDTSYDALDVGIIGTVKCDSVIFSNGARPGDKVLAGIDLDGRVYPSYNLAWDNTTKRSPEDIKRQLNTMVEIGERQLATAGKDISNPGTLGTLGMLLESSGVGAIVELDKIPRPDAVEQISFEHWLKMYPGTGFVLTVENEEKGAECIKIFRDAGVEASIIGEIDNSKKLKITNGAETATVFDLDKEIITGIKHRD